MDLFLILMIQGFSLDTVVMPAYGLGTVGTPDFEE